MLFTDLNSSVNLPLLQLNSLAGNFSGDKPANANAIALSTALFEHRMAAINSFWPVGPTFFSAQGATSHIDHIFVPQAAVKHVVRCNAWRRTAEQIRASPYYLDHIPVVVVLSVSRAPPPHVRSLPRYDRNKMAASLQRGTGRREFLEELETEMEKNEVSFQAARCDPDAARHSLLFTEIVHLVARRHFSRKPSSRSGMLMPPLIAETYLQSVSGAAPQRPATM